MAKVKNMFKFFKPSSELPDWNRTDEKFLKAVEAYDINKVVSILNKKQVSTTKCGPRGYAALHYVCVKGFEDMTDLFITHGADVNIVNEKGNSALHLAVHNGFAKIVCKLLMAGARIDFQNPYQMTALHVACNSKNENMVRILIENGADVNDRDKTQKTPLFFSCYHGHFGICEYLVEKGAIINAQDISKVTPLLTAVRQNHLSISKFLLEKGADPYIMDNFDVSAVKAGQETNSREMKKLFGKLPLTSPNAKSNPTSSSSLQTRTSVDLSVQVMENLSFGDDLKSELEDVQLRKTSVKKDMVNNEKRPLSAPPPPPTTLHKVATSSMSKNVEDWELLEKTQSEITETPDLTDSLHSVSENIKDKELEDSLNVFPCDNGDSVEASFLGLSSEEHRSRLSSSSLSDIQNKWNPQKEDEDVISETSQFSDEARMMNQDNGLTFLPGNVTPKMGGNTSLRRQILNLRQENNQLREDNHENQGKLKDREEEIRNLENLLSEEKTKNINVIGEYPEVLPEDDNNTQEKVSLDAEENDVSLNEKISKLMVENKQFMQSLELQNPVLEQKNYDNRVSNLLQENLKLMQNLEKLTKQMNKASSDFEIEPKEEVIEVVNEPDSNVHVIQELEDLKGQHVDLQNNYDDLVCSQGNLQEEFDQMQEERDKLKFNLMRLKLDNEQATKQNCNLLNMKDNLQQELEEMVEQQKNLQEKYDLVCEKTEFLEKTVEKSDDDVGKLGHFDDTEDLLHAVEAKGALWENDKHTEELKVLQLDNSLLEEQCRKLLLEKDILEEENSDLKANHDEMVKKMKLEIEELQAEKIKLAEKLKDVTKETDGLQQKYSILQQETHFLKSQFENAKTAAGNEGEFNLMLNTENELGTNSKIGMLQNENTRLQQELMQTVKKHEEIVHNYRLHLISAIQGYIDPDVEKALYSIIELRRMEFHC